MTQAARHVPVLQVAICCFDKTGTLTSDNMILTGLSGVPGSAEGLQEKVQEAPRETIRVLACCQALIQVDGDLVGDPLEQAAFLASGRNPHPLARQGLKGIKSVAGWSSTMRWSCSYFQACWHSPAGSHNISR